MFAKFVKELLNSSFIEQQSPLSTLGSGLPNKIILAMLSCQKAVIDKFIHEASGNPWLLKTFFIGPFCLNGTAAAEVESRVESLSS